MTKMDITNFEHLKAAVKAATPAGWRYRLTSEAGPTVRMEVTAAPVDLLAHDAAVYGTGRAAYVKVCPTGYEGLPGSAIGGIWKALHTGNDVEFDADGERTGRWHAAELWIGHWKRPFAVTQ